MARMPGSARDASSRPDPASPAGLRIDDPGLRGRPVRVTFDVVNFGFVPGDLGFANSAELAVAAKY